MSYEDDLPHITRPGHVDEDVWEICYGNYVTALARYRRAVAAVSDEIREGRVPTEDQRQAEDAAYDVLMLARTAMLDLCGYPPSLD